MQIHFHIEDREKRERLKRILSFAAFLIVLFLIMIAAAMGLNQQRRVRARDYSAQKEQIDAEEQELTDRKAVIQKAEAMAVGYDYDGAIALLQSVKNYQTDSQIQKAIATFTAEKAKLEAKDPNKVPHIFFHSLIVDTSRAFDTEKWGTEEVAGINAWMTTVDEFDKIMQQLYDNGYVLVKMRDLVKETHDADGTVHFVKNDSLLLPADKKPIVLSIDDWSYYHTYTGRGYGSRAVLDENGDVKVEYTDADGKTTVGDYDVVPRLDSFVEEHPDFSYKGARGLIAMTGYNGVFGYRTDAAYKTGKNLDQDQKEWLDEHPDFDWDKEVAAATKVADAVKAEGWEFASHTWGHLSVTQKTLDELKTDNEKWQKTVANITGKTDTIIFAHGNDIGDWHDYNAETNKVYAYYKSQGFNFYANVDASSPSWVQIRDAYVRQGRIDCDGLQMWRAISGEAKINVFEDLFDVKSVFSKDRPTPVSATGKA
ncbi:MAG: polysaccharide deacetylase family protein [Lachnospiraceae bacterium]|nr:polysaccharide deacetylase family protein [Lachnospiraceae bacterium]